MLTARTTRGSTRPKRRPTSEVVWERSVTNMWKALGSVNRAVASLNDGMVRRRKERKCLHDVGEPRIAKIRFLAVNGPRSGTYQGREGVRGPLPFLIMETPVTNAQFWMYVREHGSVREGRTPAHGWGEHSHGIMLDNYPVVGVSYEQALGFCDWLGDRLYRRHDSEGTKRRAFGLPDEQQWEWAAGGEASGRDGLWLWTSSEFVREIEFDAGGQPVFQYTRSEYLTIRGGPDLKARSSQRSDSQSRSTGFRVIVWPGPFENDHW